MLLFFVCALVWNARDYGPKALPKPLMERLFLSTRRVKTIVQYDGAGFVGWQAQARGATVQQALEAALERLLGQPIKVHAAGRTDAGVHARAMPVHFDMDHSMPIERLALGVARFLPPGVSVLTSEEAPPEFDARRRAVLRWYRYQILRSRLRRPLGPRAWQVHRPLDLDAIESGLSILRGHHDFRGFRSSHCQSQRTELTLEAAEMTTHGDVIAFDFKCRSFLHHMVRFLTGTLTSMGLGQIDAPRLRRILDDGERPQRILCAPPEGLCLMDVAYTDVERERILAARPAPPSF